MDLNPEIVCMFIDRAREFQAKEEVVFPEESFGPSDDWALQVLADHANDFSFQDAKAAVDDLEPDQQAQLAVLMWIGRGDYDVAEWDEALQEALEVQADQGRTAEYLLATPLVVDYLTEGLAAFDYSCND